METIGSAERSCDVEMMRDTFHSITDGEYSKLLYKLFSQERVEAELEKFLEFDFFPRVGGGIGLTRLLRAVEDYKSKKVKTDDDREILYNKRREMNRQSVHGILQ